MKSKIFKYIITTIIVLLSIMAMNPIVEAKNISGNGDRIQVDAYGRGGWQSYIQNGIIDGYDDTYCVYPHMDLFQGSWYDILYRVRIEGTKAKFFRGNTTDESAKINETDNRQNAAMAWILAQRDPVQGTPMNRGYSPKQLAIYGYFGTWMSTTGIGDFITRSLKYSNSAWEVEAQKYAQSVDGQTGASVTSNKNKDDKPIPEIVTYTYEGKEEEGVKVGPFNVNIDGNVDGVQVQDQDNKDIATLFGKYEGENFVVSPNAADIIKSGVDFYIVVPGDGTVETITKAELSVTKPIETVAVDLWLVGKRGSGVQTWNQNLITSVAQPNTTPDNIKFNLIDEPVDLLGNLEVVKVNKNNHEIKLKGVPFKFKNSKSEKWVSQDENGKNVYVENESDAKIFTTDENGHIEIKDLIVGTYIAYEQEGNPNYGYELPPEGKTVKVTVKDDESIIENRQVKIKVSGFVWVDENVISGKSSVRNDRYKTKHDPRFDGENDDTQDKVLPGIKVKLKLKGENGEPDTVEQEATTDEEGKYLFEDVYIDKLSRYYIEFEYDGLVYTNVLPWNKLEKTEEDEKKLAEVDLAGKELDAAPHISKAAESKTTRNEFNNNFAKIEGEDPEKNTGVIIDNNGKIYKERLDYTRGEGDNLHKSFFNYENHSFPIHAETTETGYNIEKQFTWGQEEVKYINLGLYKREQADLSLQKDIQNARVSINGYDHSYNYANRYKPGKDYEEGFNVGVKFSDDRGNSRYTRAIYKADAVWTQGPEQKQLTVGVTYKIRLINESDTVNAKVNKVIDYFDKNYNIAETGAVGTGVDNKGLITGSLEYKVGEEIGDTGYRSLTITPSDEMIKALNNGETVEENPEDDNTEQNNNTSNTTNETNNTSNENMAYIPERDMPNGGKGNLITDNTSTAEQAPEGYAKATSVEDSDQEEDVKAAKCHTNYQDIYVYFTMNREQVKDIAILDDNEPEEDKILDNTAEIASFSTFDQNGNPYAAIDEDSAPGNIKLGDENTYEDDTDTAPEFILKIGAGAPDERQIKGNIFEDLDKDKLDNLLRGDGIYDTEKESPIEGVHVSLVDEENGIEYTQSIEMDENGEQTVGDEWISGKYGDYTIRGFVPGNYKIKFTWGNGKGTINRKLEDGNEENVLVDTRDYKSTTNPEEEFNRKQNDPKWYKDDVDKRYSDAFDDEGRRNIIDGDTKEIVYGNSVKGADPSTSPSPEMYSYTQPMELTVELEDYEQGVTIVDENGKVTANDNNGKDVYLMYVIENVDFGIIGRPIQDLQITKHVKNIKYILPTGQTIIEANVVEDANGNRKLEKDVPGLTYIPSAEANKHGMLRLEVDSELMHGSTLEVTYEFKAQNKGQLDFVDSRWYNIGDIDPATMDSAKMVTLSASEVVDYLDKDWGYDMEKNSNWQEITLDEMRNMQLPDGTVYFASNGVLDENLPNNEIADRRILKTESLKGRLAPEANPFGLNSSNTTTLEVSKVVSTQDDIDLGNETEIIRVTKETNENDPGNGNPGGGRVVSTPGSSVPGISETEMDSAEAENTVVTLPSGDNTIINYIIYTTIGIIALAIFGAGIVIIKKKALKK